LPDSTSLSPDPAEKSSDNSGEHDPLFQRVDDISEIRRIQAAYHKTDRNAVNNFFAGQVDAVFPAERGRKSEDTYAGEFDEDTDIDDENDIIIEYYRAKELARNFRDTGKWRAETAEDKRLVEWIRPILGIVVRIEQKGNGAEYKKRES
jgi:hypothetical protein